MAALGDSGILKLQKYPHVVSRPSLYSTCVPDVCTCNLNVNLHSMYILAGEVALNEGGAQVFGCAVAERF